MRFRIIELRGVGPQNAKKLENVGLYYAFELKEMDVKEISGKTGISEENLQMWKDYMSLMQFRHIGPNYANLLHREDVGIKTIRDFAHKNPNEILQKMKESNKRRRLVKVLPNIEKINDWISIAQKIFV